MSTVVIAYFNDTNWLVKGTEHLYDMLAAKEAADLEITFVTCKMWAEVMRMWEEPEEGKMPWAIHPKVVERLKSREHTTVS